MLTVQSLCDSGPRPPAISATGSIADVIALFQEHPRMRLLPVLDPAGVPIGAIFEEDVRQILFNPYGHALLRNPSFGRSLSGWVKPCPVADVEVEIGTLLGLYAQAGGQEGMIVTRDGRYHDVIGNRTLVSAAGAYELERIRRREEELDRLRAAGTAFEGTIRTLIADLSHVAQALGETAAATAERGEATGRRASLVATAALQTGTAMSNVADHGRGLVATLDRLGDETAQAKAATRDAVAAVAQGGQRTDALYQSTASIESITGLIDQLAGKVGMLAINATIEAARAGEAGRGFGIVAGEVRGLAGQTRDAALEIRRHAIGVRHAVDEVVAGQSGIEQVIAGIERIGHTVDATVGAQRRMTQEIAAGAEQAAGASAEIRDAVEAIHGTARAAASGALEIAQTAQALLASSGGLMDRVSAFLEEVRAA